MLSAVLARVAPLFVDAIQSYLGGSSPAAFERAMQTALSRAHGRLPARPGGAPERVGLDAQGPVAC